MRRLFAALLFVGLFLSGCSSARNAQFANEYAATLYNLGNSYRELKEYPNAVASYREALLIDPTLDVARVNLYITYMDLKAYKEALALMVQLSDDYPDNITYQKQLAYTYYLNGKLPAARNVYESLYANNPEDYEALANIAQIYVLEENYTKAKETYTILHRMDAADATIYMKLGDIEEHIGKSEPEDATRWYELAFSADPKSVDALEAIIRLGESSKNHRQVYDAYDRLEGITKNPGEPTFRKSKYAFLVTKDYLVGLDLLAQSMELGFHDWEAIANFKGEPEMEPFAEQVDLIIKLYMPTEDDLLEDDVMEGEMMEIEGEELP